MPKWRCLKLQRSVAKKKDKCLVSGRAFTAVQNLSGYAQPALITHDAAMQGRFWPGVAFQPARARGCFQPCSDIRVVTGKSAATAVPRRRAGGSGSIYTPVTRPHTPWVDQASGIQ